MRRKLLLIFATCLATGAGAQAQKNYEGYFRQPMDGVQLCSGNFAETRSNHFHSGVDIKTGGAEGKQLYAVADGYVCRIGIAPRGFGRVLYINHPNGTTSVYAHMQKFTPEIEAYVRQQRYAQRKHAIDLYPEAGAFPVKKGDKIGLSGNSGSSGGPHLHFEMRDGATQEPINPLTSKVISMKDDIPPTIVRLHYIEVDTVAGVPVNSAPKAIAVAKTSATQYRLADTAALVIGPRGYFVLEATDRKNDTHNTMGIYRVAATLDGQALFGFALDRFSYANTRYVNSLCHYAMQKGSRNQMLRLALQENNRLPVYTKMQNRGLVILRDTDRHRVEIVAEDDNGNRTTLSFAVRRRAEDKPFHTLAGDRGDALNCHRGLHYESGGCLVEIPEMALYESLFFEFERQDEPGIKGGNTATFPLYSPVYRILDAGVPLHKAMSVSIDGADVPEDLRSKACLGIVSADGTKISSMGGSYANGRVTGKVSIFGRYCIVADVTPPTVTPNFTNGADLRGKSSIGFALKDDFSGIASFRATIDGEWIIFEEQSGTITHRFDPEKVTYSGGKHALELIVTDTKGNRTVVKREFIR